MRRLVLLCAAIAALLAGTSMPQSAQAFGFERDDGVHDPYFYRPESRSWYPYYNSGQWRSAKEMRWRKRVALQRFYYPQYNPVWGHPLDRDEGWYVRHHARRHLGHR